MIYLFVRDNHANCLRSADYTLGVGVHDALTTDSSRPTGRMRVVELLMTNKWMVVAISSLLLGLLNGAVGEAVPNFQPGGKSALAYMWRGWVGAADLAREKKKKEGASTYEESVAWFKKGEAMIGTAKENSEEQAEAFRHAAELQPDFYEAHYNVALIYANQKKRDAAIAALRVATRLKPEQENALYMLGLLFQEAKDDTQALEQFDAILKNNSLHFKALASKAYSLANLNQTPAAIAAFEQAIKLDPTQVENHYNLALLYLREKNEAKAVDELSAVLTLDAGNPVANYHLGSIYFGQKKYREAIEALKKSLVAAPNSKLMAKPPSASEVLSRLIEAYLQLSDYAQAEKALKEVLKAEPKNATVYSSLAYVLNKQKKLEEAVELIRQGVAVHPQHADLIALLADAQSALGRTDEAIANFQRATALKPSDKNLLYNLGTLFAQQGKLTEAAEALSQAIALDQNFANARINLAIVYDRKNEEAKAIEQYEKILELGAKDAQAHFRLATIYARRGRKEVALGHLENALKLDREKYLKILQEDKKNVTSELDNIRYTARYEELLKGPKD